MRCLSTLMLLLLGLLLQACNSGDSSGDPVAADGAQIVIVSPASGSTVRTLPATLQVQLRNVDPRSLRARLSGVDISAAFGAADADGMRVAVVSMPALHVGLNQLQVSAGSAQADAAFMVDLASPGASAAAGLPLLVPIRTRVLCAGCDGSSETHYNVAVYADPADPDHATLHAAPQLPAGAAPNQGFQLLYLNRIDLSVVSNTSIANPPTNLWQGSALITALSADPPAECGNPAPGCLLVVQSFGSIGHTPCLASQVSTDCQLSSAALQKAGASGRLAYANGSNPQVAYSFIGNISAGSNGAPDAVPAGTYHERLQCAGSNASLTAVCDALADASIISGTAPSGATPERIGALSAALVRDNFYNYSAVQNAPMLQFSSVYDSDNISHGFTINGNTLWSGFARGLPQQGGVHVVVVDSADPTRVLENRWFPADRCASQLYGADRVSGAGPLIERYDSQAYLVFFAAFGDTRYTPMSGQCIDRNGNSVPNYSRADNANFAELMNRLGGTWQVWFLANYPNSDYPGNSGLTDFQDDYTLVGAFRDAGFTGLQDQRGAELSSVISRETLRYPRPSRIEGVLVMNNQGQYRPLQATHNLGLFNTNQMSVAGASRLNPVRWPMPGSNPQAAYQWFSSRLCCNDIRAAYINQNVSPDVWLTLLQQQLYEDTGPQPAFSSADFTAMQQQLQTEFIYLSSVRRLQANLFQLYQQRQAAVPLLLIQAQDEVLRNLQIDLNTTVGAPKWASITNSVLGVLGGVSTIAGIAGVEGGGPVIATGIKTALALGQLGVTVAADETAKSAGTSLKAEENVELAAGQLAAKVLDSYSTNLGQMANQFDRVVSDWGRLKAMGGPLAAGLMPWDNSASFMLMQSYDRAIRREFYTALLQANTQITVFEQAAAGPRNNNTWYNTSNPTPCRYDRTTVNPYWGLTTAGSGSNRQQLPILFYPSGMPDTISRGDLSYPYDYAWSVWALVLSTHASDLCPLSHSQPNTFGLFTPLDPDDSSGLGAYRFWWFTRNPGFNVYRPQDADNGGQWASCDRNIPNSSC